jgi:hypothetical protein
VASPFVLQREESPLALGVERVAVNGQPEPGARLLVAAGGGAGHPQLMRNLRVSFTFAG